MTAKNNQLPFNIPNQELKSLVISNNCNLFLGNVMGKKIDSRMKIYKCIAKLQDRKQQEFIHALWVDGICPVGNSLSKYIKVSDFKSSLSANWEFNISNNSWEHFGPNYIFSAENVAYFSEWTSQYIAQSINITAQELDEIILNLEEDEFESLRKKEYNGQGDGLKYLQEYIKMRMENENSELKKRFLDIYSKLSIQKEQNQEQKRSFGSIS